MINLNGAINSNTNQVDDFFRISIAETSKGASDIANQGVAKWAEKTIDSFKIDMGGIAQSLEKMKINFDWDLNLERVSEIAEQQESIMDRLEVLRESANEINILTDAQLSDLGIKRDELERTIQNLNANYQEAQDAIRYIDDNYQPHYIQKPSKLGSVLNKVGSALDIAMLAIPAIGWEKGATMLAGKAAIMASKGTKIATLGSKALTTASNVAKIAAKTDMAKDVVTLIGMTKAEENKDQQEVVTALTRISDRVGEIVAPQTPHDSLPTKKKASFFDYLSLSYWFGKFGEMIDPPTEEIDMEYESRVREARNECQNRAFMIARQRISEERELGRIKSEAHAKQLENEFRNKALLREQEACNQKIRRLAQKKDEAERSCVLNALTSQFKIVSNDVLRRIENSLDEILDEIFINIVASTSQFYCDQLNVKKGELEIIRQQKEKSSLENSSIISEIDRLYAEIG